MLEKMYFGWIRAIVKKIIDDNIKQLQVLILDMIEVLAGRLTK